VTVGIRAIGACRLLGRASCLNSAVGTVRPDLDDWDGAVSTHSIQHEPMAAFHDPYPESRHSASGRGCVESRGGSRPGVLRRVAGRFFLVGAGIRTRRAARRSPGRKRGSPGSASPDRCHQRCDADDRHHPFQVVGEHLEADLRPDVRQATGQEVGCSHPALERAEDVLDG
jgi:hypothetical protein